MTHRKFLLMSLYHETRDLNLISLPTDTKDTSDTVRKGVTCNTKTKQHHDTDPPSPCHSITNGLDHKNQPHSTYA